MSWNQYLHAMLSRNDVFSNEENSDKERYSKRSLLQHNSGTIITGRALFFKVFAWQISRTAPSFVRICVVEETCRSNFNVSSNELGLVVEIDTLNLRDNNRQRTFFKWKLISYKKELFFLTFLEYLFYFCVMCNISFSKLVRS